MPTPQQFEEGIRRAHAAGDEASVRVLGQQLLASRQQPRSWLDRAKMVGSDVVAGLGDLADTIQRASPVGIGQGFSNLLTGPSQEKGLYDTIAKAKGQAFADAHRQEISDAVYGKGLGNRIYEATGAPKPATRGERLASTVTRGASAGLATGGASAAGGVGNALRTIATDTVGGASGGAGAQIGGEYGGKPGSLFGAIVGGLLGGGAVSRIGRPNTAEVNPVAQAAQQEGVPISRPIIDPSVRTKMGYLESTIGGNQPVRRSLDATLSAIEQRAAQLQGRGTPQEAGVMGQRFQSSIGSNIKAQRMAAGKIFDKASTLAGDAPVYGRDIAASLDADIARLSRNPNQNKAVIDYLTGLRADFVNPQTGDWLPKTVDDIRQFRTNLRGDINSRNLTQTPAEAIATRALDQGKRDIARDMLDAGPNGRMASDLYREGDIRWRLAKRDEKQIAEKLIGPANNPITGRDAMGRAMSWLSSGADNGTHAARFWQKLSPEDRADFAATVASKYGQKAPDEPFSPAQFISATRTIPPSSRALLFGPEGAQSIANLRTLAKAYQETTKMLNNSRSGVNINWDREINGLLRGFGIGGTIGGAAGGAVGGPVVGAIGAAAGAAIGTGAKTAMQRLSARALMNPDVSKWLSVAPRQTNPAAIASHVEKLTTIAARNPVIAHEVLDLQKSLMQSLGTALPLPGKVAASGNERPDNTDKKANAQ